MRQILLFAFLAIAFPRMAPAQTTTATKSPNPEFMNIIYFWPGDTLRPLEKTTGEMKMKMVGFMGRGGGGGASIVVAGSHSPARLKAGGDIRFAIRLNSMMDPSSMIKLYRFDARKNTRESPTDGDKKHLVDCNIKKSGDDVYLLLPATQLAPGEYGFQVMMMAAASGFGKMSYTFFAFGVDQ